MRATAQVTFLFHIHLYIILTDLLSIYYRTIFRCLFWFNDIKVRPNTLKKQHNNQNTFQALFMAGVMIGSYSFGWLSDRAGRKPAFFIAVVIQVDY